MYKLFKWLTFISVAGLAFLLLLIVFLKPTSDNGLWAAIGGYFCLGCFALFAGITLYLREERA
ncbi:MAG: hypothetical protein Q7S53_03515 [bacterium]|nr:hypothetical protein [bacterium]